MSFNCSYANPFFANTLQVVPQQVQQPTITHDTLEISKDKVKRTHSEAHGVVAVVCIVAIISFVAGTNYGFRLGLLSK